MASDSKKDTAGPTPAKQQADDHPEEAAAAPGRTSRERAALAQAWLKRNWAPVVLVLFMAAAFALRAYYFNKHTVYTTDSYYYLLLARSLRAGLGYTVRGFGHAKYLPGYPLLIMLFSVLGRSFAQTAGYLAIVSAVGTMLFTYLLGRELFGKVAGLVGAALLGFSPVFVQYTSFPMTEGVFTFLFTAGIYLMLTGAKRSVAWRRLVGAGLGGLALLTRFEGVLFLPLAVLVLILWWREAKLKKWEVPAMLALYIVPVGIFLLRNLIAFGKLSGYTKEFESNSNITLRLMFDRGRYMAWTTLYGKALYYVGAVCVLLFRKFKAFFVLAGWYLLFLGFHLFWYYAHPRFLSPAIPALALMGAFVFQFISDALVKLVRRDDKARALIGRVFKRTGEGLSRAMVVCGYAGLVLLVAVFGLLLARTIQNANTEVTIQYKVMAGDMGGKGIPLAASYVKQHLTDDQQIAANVGPYFNFEFGKNVLYVRGVPAGIPFEHVDVTAPNIVGKLAKKNVKYLVISGISGGPDTLVMPGVPVEARRELTAIGVQQSEVPRLKMVRFWNFSYDTFVFDKRIWAKRDVFVAVFEVLPQQ